MNTDNKAAGVVAIPDIGAIIAHDTGTLAIKGADGKPLGWDLTLAGPGHPVSIQLEEEQTARAREDARRAGQAAKAGHDLPDEDPKERGDRQRDAFARRIIGWNPVAINGETFEYTPAAAKRLMTEPQFVYIQAQVISFLATNMAFTAPSAKA